MTKKVDYRLEAVAAESAGETPSRSSGAEIVPVTGTPWTAMVDRRSSLGLGMGFAGVFDSLVKGALGMAALAQKADAALCVAGAFPHSASVYGVRISADGRQLISVSSDRTIKVWSLPDRALVRTFFHDGAAVAISPDGTRLAAALPAEIQIFPSTGGQPVSLPDSAKANSIAFTPDGKTLVSEVGFWSIPDGRLIRRLTVSPGYDRLATPFSEAVAVSPDGRICAARGRLWSIPDGVLLGTYGVESGTYGDFPLSVAFSPAGDMLASAQRGEIELRSVPEGILVGRFQAASLVRSVAFSRDGKMLVTAGSELELRSIPDGRRLKPLPGHVNAVMSLAITPDGATLVSSGEDKTIRLWTLPGGEAVNVCLMDIASSQSTAQGMRYTQSGTTYTVACGTPLPPGAVCTCNCVAGAQATPSSGGTSGGGTSGGGGGGGGGGGSCQCNLICTCDRICTCNRISTRRYKENIEDLSAAPDALERLRPVFFDWTAEAPHGRTGREAGFIAEELADILPAAVKLDAEGNPISVDYGQLITVLVEVAKRQQQQIRELREQVRNIEAKVAAGERAGCREA